jgi:hypothetical protein
MRALPEHFQGNALALLPAVYRDPSLSLSVSIEVAGRALPTKCRRRPGHAKVSSAPP